MSELPITQNQYNNSVLITDFISKLKLIIESSGEISSYRFVPKIGGYEINLETSKNKFLIQLFTSKTVFSNKLKIIIIKDYNKIQSFISKSLEDNEEVFKDLVVIFN